MEKRWYIQTNVGIDGLKLYDEKIGINWKWQSMDGAITKAPLGEKKVQDQILQTEEVNPVPNVVSW